MTRRERQPGETISRQEAPLHLSQGVGSADDVKGDEVFSKLLQLVRTVQAGMQNIDTTHGLSGSQLWALWQISAHPGQRVSELAAALHIHPSTASNLLDKLETGGLVRRERRDSDNRVVRLYLSEAGLELVKEIPGPMKGKLRQALQQVPAPILTGLFNGVKSVLSLMDKASSKKSG